MAEQSVAILADFKKRLAEINLLSSMSNVISYDMETACPPLGRDYETKELVWLGNRIFALSKDPQLLAEVAKLWQDKDSLDAELRAIVTNWHRDIEKNKNVSPELNEEATANFTHAFDVWLVAKSKKNYSLFEDQLAKNVALTKRIVGTRDNPAGLSALDWCIDDLASGYRTSDLDAYFAKMKAGLLPLIAKVYASKKTIRDDFLSRPVPLWKQQEFSHWLMKLLGFDFAAGSLGETEHPFTNRLGPKDERVATHYFEKMMVSNLYSICHETGHALFAQNIPAVQKAAGCDNFQTFDMDESVSRFYENVIGRSEAFIDLIFPKMQQVYAPALDDVTAHEFFLAANKVFKQPLRTEADELTYSLHIIIRYEIEKGLFAGTLTTAGLDKVWNRKYKDYLGITVKDDREGILQDVHWADSFGYFPVYAMGNGYNAAYGKLMDRAFATEGGLAGVIRAGRMDRVLAWMKDNVFAKANLLTAKEWTVAVTGRPLQCDDFIAYLDKKYTAIYDL